MKLNYLLFFGLMGSSFLSIAQSAPIFGDTTADSHQLCGKNINVQIKNTDDDFVIIGLMNNKNHSLDFFKSSSPVSKSMIYTRYTPVRFDDLSKRFINIDNTNLDIIWGSSNNENHEVKYTLALGSEVYSCGTVQKWPSETANLLYGDQA